MAVEARHQRSLFSPQILTSREFVTSGGGCVEGNGSVFGVPVGYGMVAPLSGTTTATEIPIAMYGGSATTGTFAAKTVALNSDSGLTCVPVSRKRSREANDHSLSSSSSFQRMVQNQNPNNRCSSVTFLGEDISFQIQQQQMEIDRFIAQHTEKVRLEFEDRRKRYSRRIAAAMEESVTKKLRAKEEEMEKLGKLNSVLEEKVKSLCVENQIWRDLAQTNEATANALRCNLEQLLSQIQDEHRRSSDDAQSCCGSNYDESALPEANTNAGGGACIAGNRCKRCDKEESCVLVLPCRHLCLCTLCGSAILTCPVCHSTKTATLLVNLS